MSDHATGIAKAIDRMTVVESYPGAWAVDAQGILISAETAAEAVTIVQAALLGTSRATHAEAIAIREGWV